MSQQNGGFPDGQQPWQGQESTSATPHVFPFGQQGEPEAAPQEPQYDAQQGSQPQSSQPVPQQDWSQQPAPQQYSPQQYDQGQYDQGVHSQPQQGSQPQAWGQAQVDQQWAQQQGQVPPQQYGQQAQPEPQDYAGQGDQWAQPQSGQFGSGPQHQSPDGQSGQAFGSQGHTQSGPPQQWNDPQAGSQMAAGQEQGSPGNQQFSGILDPHTGEIHPVPDLQNLDETDALLVVVSGPDAGAQILLDTDVVTVGRSPNADIFLDDVTVSRKHAEFVRTPSGFTLRDTGSLNGTYVGRQLIDSIELQNGADVQIGKFRMIFQQRPRTN
ncbi:MAG: FHA domain-containing protein [Brevibacterium yomogidense]|uniref:FHA domain-containing protein n=1 Tax=Brevibacterium sp. Mu109 TaxID=1255669 RepID=UPI000C65361D|nr:Forkhead associated (FHA) domain, binds pSer, pThr, pTyr [Brevibacterium sp. Mu109]